MNYRVYDLLKRSNGLPGRLIVLTLFAILSFSATFAQDIEWSSLGPEGGFLLCLAVAPGSPDVLYAGCDIYGGIYKSADGGENWQFRGLVSERGSIVDIKIHPDSSHIAYAACGLEGVYKTVDGGQNWDPVFQRDDIVYAVGINPDSPNEIYVGLIAPSKDYALYHSMDGGSTWPDSSLQRNSVVDICFDPDSSNTLYAGTSYGVQRTKDQGKTWTFLGPPAPSATIQTLAVVDYNTFYAGSLFDERDDGTVYKTVNGGDTWEISYDLGTPIYGLAVDPGNRNTLYMAAGGNKFGQEGVFKTIDGGDTWLPVNTGLTDRMARDIKVNPVTPNIVYAATDGLGGVYKSTDGAANWNNMASGMKQTLVQAMCFDGAHTLYTAVGWGTYRDIPCLFRSNDNGISWDTLRTVPSPYYMTSVWDIVADPDSAGLIYVAGMSYYSEKVEEPSLGLLCRSHDGGSSWETLWTPDNLWILCLAIDPNTKYIYAGTGGADQSQVYKIYRSTDGGDTWEATSGWPSQGNPIFDIVIDPVAPNILYAGTGGAIFKSTDYGLNWTLMAILPFSYTLFIDPNTPNIIYAGSGGPYAENGGVHRSVDSGVTWELIGLADYPITSITGISDPQTILYAGTGGEFLKTNGDGIFRSMDQGTTWEPVNASLTSPFVLSMQIDPQTPNKIYAGTMGRGLFVTIDNTVSNNNQFYIHLPESMTLNNFPNPFNASTCITYHLPEKSHVTIQIFDMSGRRVALLKDEQQSRGDHTVQWNGEDANGDLVVSGLYLCSLKAGSLQSVGKMLLVK